MSDAQRLFARHVTVGRVARGERLEPTPLDAPALRFASPALTLYRSRTDPSRARYEPLARAEL